MTKAASLMDRRPFYYPDYIVDALNRLGRASLSKQYPLLNKRIDLIHVLFNQFENYPITEQVYSYIWWMLNSMTKAGNVEWVKEYWSYAVQYCRFHFGSHSNDNSGKDQFEEFHLMVGVIMIHLRQFDVLKHIMSYTNSLPAQYPLVPSTFSGIWNWYKKLSKKNQWEMYLLKYQLIGMKAGALEESKTEGLLLDYVSLLMIRLNTVNDYNITFSNPMSLPVLETTFEQIDADCNVAEVIIKRINKWRKDRSTLKELGFSSADAKNALELLQQFQSECKAEQKRITNAPSISARKKAELRNNLLQAIDSVVFKVPVITNPSGGFDLIELSEEQSVKLDESLILSGHDPISNNLCEVVVGALAYKIQQSYCYQFLLNNTANSFSVPYRDVSKALERLSLDGNYSILAMGVSPHLFEEVEGFTRKEHASCYTYKGADVIEIASNENSFIVMKKDAYPTVSLRPLPDSKLGDEMIEINNLKHLYSNVDSIKLEDLVLKVMIGYQLNVPSPFRYVRLRVLYQLESDLDSLSRIKQITEYL